MEKSWENFWTTGKVEDYLTYRNRANACENGTQQEHQSEAGVQRETDTEKDKSVWKGFM